MQSGANLQRTGRYISLSRSGHVAVRVNLDEDRASAETEAYLRRRLYCWMRTADPPAKR